MAKLGIENNGVFIGAMSLPNRKKPCLVIEEGNEINIIGSFINTSSIDMFEKALKTLLSHEDKMEIEL